MEASETALNLNTNECKDQDETFPPTRNFFIPPPTATHTRENQFDLVMRPQL